MKSCSVLVGHNLHSEDTRSESVVRTWEDLSTGSIGQEAIQKYLVMDVSLSQPN